MHPICVLGLDQQDYFRQKDSKGSILALLGLKNTLTCCQPSLDWPVHNGSHECKNSILGSGETRPNGLGRSSSWYLVLIHISRWNALRKGGGKERARLKCLTVSCGLNWAHHRPSGARQIDQQIQMHTETNTQVQLHTETYKQVQLHRETNTEMWKLILTPLPK